MEFIWNLFCCTAELVFIVILVLGVWYLFEFWCLELVDCHGSTGMIENIYTKLIKNNQGQQLGIKPTEDESLYLLKSVPKARALPNQCEKFYDPI